MLKHLGTLIKVSRPVFWLLVALLFFVGVVVSGAPITVMLLAHLMLVTFLLPLIVFGVNDVYDYDSDSINQRKRYEIGGTALEKENHLIVLAASVVVTVLLIIFSAITRNLTNMLATLVTVSIAWAYSAKAVRLKEIPILDSLSNAVLVCSVILLGFSYGGIMIRDFPQSIYFASLGAAAVHSIAAIVDYSPDKKSRTVTIATFFGKKIAAVFAAAVMITILLFSGIQSLSLRIIMYYALISSLVLVVKDDERLAKRLSATGFVVAVAMIAVFVYQQFYK